MPKATVAAIITRRINNEIDILLTKRNIEPFKDYWCLPGGHIDSNEDAVTAVIREVKEETNLDIHPEFLTYQDEIFPNRGVHNVVLIFYGYAGNEIKADPVEVSDIRWFPLPQVTLMKLAFNHSEAIRIFLEKTDKNLE